MDTPPYSRVYRNDSESPQDIIGDGQIEVIKRAVRSRSAVPIDRFSYRDEWARSKSPLLRRAGLSTQPSSQSLASDLERPVTARKKTPVFDDLPTAYSFVVSAKARQRASQVAASYSEENSIPLSDLDPESPHEKLPLLGNLPARPPLAVVPASRRNSNLGIVSSDQSQTQLASEKRTAQTSDPYRQPTGKPGDSVLAHIKNALSTHAARDDRSGQRSALHWHKCSSDHIADAIKRESLRVKKRTLSRQSITSEADPSSSQDMDGGGSSNYHSSLNDHPPDSIQHDGWNPRTAHFGADVHGYHPFRTGHGSSIPEGSTVGNIYVHYMGSEAGESSDDGRSVGMSPTSRDFINRRASGHGFPSSPKNQRLRFPPLPPNPKLLGPEGGSSNAQRHPPNFSLPKQANQHLEVQHTIASASQDVNHSRNLLGNAQGSKALEHHRASVGDPSQLGLDLAKAHPELIQKTGKGKGKASAYDGNGPEVIVSPANPPDESPEDIDLQKRLPLEKEVSRALRRASGYSVYSVGSNSTSPRERYEDLPSETPTYRAIKSLLRRNAEITPPSDTESAAGQERTQDQPFFDRHAIASRWVTTRQRTTVRVPINQVSLPDSPPESPPEDFNTPFGRRHEIPDDDFNDWETVGESALGRPLGSDLFGGTVQRAGSSIANHSDDDVLGLESFSSTDRITQHPGNIHYSGGYRQRDLKKSRIPVFLPVFREHKVNGYLSDSTRIRPPPNPFYKTPPPLKKAHENPFQSPPPEVMPRVKSHRPPNVNLFPPLSHSHAHREPDVSGRRLYQPNKQVVLARRSSQDSGWMDDFGDPGPMITTHTDQVLRATAPEYSATWQDVIPYDNNHRIADKNQTDGFVEMQTYGGKADAKKQRDHKPFVKGPPGAFYRGLREVSTSEDKLASSSHQRKRSAKNTARRKSVKDLPTNTLRPLSLLTDHRPSTPTDQISRGPTETPGNDFVYRSPLAPPRRNSWKELYTESQMERIRDAAKSDGMFGPQLNPPEGFRQSMKMAGSQKRLFEAPRLAVFARHSSNQTGLVRQKRKLSTVVLCLCTLFPPMLVLYAMGALDGIVSCWTRGQCSSFGRGHKRVACILMYIWALLMLLGLIAFLVCWFVFLHPLGSA